MSDLAVATVGGVVDLYGRQGSRPRGGDVVWAIDVRSGAWRRAVARDPFSGGRYFQVEWGDGATSSPIVVCQHGHLWYHEDEWRRVVSDACFRGPRVGEPVSIRSLTGKVATFVSRVEDAGPASSFWVMGRQSTRYSFVGDDRWERSSFEDVDVYDINPAFPHAMNFPQPADLAVTSADLSSLD